MIKNNKKPTIGSYSLVSKKKPHAGIPELIPPSIPLSAFST